MVIVGLRGITLDGNSSDISPESLAVHIGISAFWNAGIFKRISYALVHIGRTTPLRARIHKKTAECQIFKTGLIWTFTIEKSFGDRMGIGFGGHSLLNSNRENIAKRL